MRQLNDWLSAYLQYTDNTESPKDFHFWTGVFILSALTERKVCLDRGFYTLFPNLYIVLVANSALCRKSTAADIGVNILTSLEKPIIPFCDTVTAPALIKHGVDYSSKICIYAPELTTLLGDVCKTGLGPIFTRLYDTPETFKTATISRGLESIKNPYVCILGCTTPSDISDVIPMSKAGGGPISRFIFVHRETPHKRIPFPTVDPDTLMLKEKLIKDAEHIKTLQGVVTFSKEGQQWYDDWYHKHCDLIEKDKSSLAQDYLGRKHELLLKVATCVLLSRSDSFSLDPTSLQIAETCLTINEPAQFKILNLTGATDKEGIATRYIGSIIQKYSPIPHFRLLQKVSWCHRYSAKEITKIIKTLVQEGRVEAITESPKGRPRRVYLWKKIT